ncbi:MarR family winged helix-turn-helix transcriptional regulator [Actinomadura rubrisoli]|uniref:MarR family winged helix-turn-helix transcriptional regulator n=1 Tax=Actinomadura rubrisoli TaxID=2530368 RepID=UPI00140429B3|nr:MarR family transcriptional regulator [Actinomadura rubrisoli]
MSNEYSEPPGVRGSSEPHRALVFATLDLGADIDTIGQVAASLIGINQTDLICLNALFRDGPMSAGRLASVIGLTSSATTTAIDRLERAGYVHRRNDPADRRRVLVAASEDGARQAFALFDGLLDALAALAGTYTEEQVALLTEMIGRFREIITAYTGELRSRESTHRPQRPH